MNDIWSQYCPLSGYSSTNFDVGGVPGRGAWSESSLRLSRYVITFVLSPQRLSFLSVKMSSKYIYTYQIFVFTFWQVYSTTMSGCSSTVHSDQNTDTSRCSVSRNRWLDLCLSSPQWWPLTSLARLPSCSLTFHSDHLLDTRRAPPIQRISWDRWIDPCLAIHLDSWLEPRLPVLQSPWIAGPLLPLALYLVQNMDRWVAHSRSCDRLSLHTALLLCNPLNACAIPVLQVCNPLNFWLNPNLIAFDPGLILVKIFLQGKQMYLNVRMQI